MPFNLTDFLYGTQRNLINTDPDFKYPLDLDHFPYAPDSYHYGKMEKQELVAHTRFSKMDFKETELKPVMRGELEDYLFSVTNVLTAHLPKYDDNDMYWKTAWEFLTIYYPDHTYKHEVFTPVTPEEIRGDKLILPNEYATKPDEADMYHDMPPYAKELELVVNITDEVIKDFSK